MLPDPLHPAVVHLPLGMALVAPAAALLAALAIRRGLVPRRVWLAVVLFQVVLLGSAWAALASGEREEERVEALVAERYIERHEDHARFLLAAGAAALVLAVLGAGPGRRGGIARGATVVATFLLLATAIRTGASGGALVYRHGAANAYLEASETSQEAAFLRLERHHDDD